MSDPAAHLVAAGPSVRVALPLVDALLAQGTPRDEETVEVTVAGASRVVDRYRAMTPPGAVANYELHIPAEHRDTYVAGLGPVLGGTDRAVDDKHGGCWWSVHDTEPDALDRLPGLPEVAVEITVTGIPRAEPHRDLIPTEADPLRASVAWDAWWPAVPELDLGPQLKHAAVWLFVNSTGSWDLDPAEPGFRLYVVTGQRDGARAAHLATLAGIMPA